MLNIRNKWAAILLPRTFIIALLFSFYMLAFVITPLWNLVPSVKSRLATLIVILIAGTIWSVVSGSALRVHFHLRDGVFFAVLLALMIALNYRQLTSGLPVMGDEDFHLFRTLFLTNKILQMQRWVLFGLFAFTIFFILAWVKPRWAEYAGAIIAIGVVFYYLTENPFENAGVDFFVRYPFISNWFAAVAPTIAALIDNPYHEALYRIMPLFFAAALAWSFQHHLPHSNTPTGLLWGISIATLPLVFYYSSILYLEMPAVFLMMVVSFRIKDLLQDDSASVKRNAGWYCLILIGFIKETTIPFLACYLACRWIVQFLQRKPGSPLYRQPVGIPVEQPKFSLTGAILGELSIAFSVLFPAFFYLVFRSMFTTTRSFGFEWMSIFEPRAYSALARSFVDQFGIFLLFFIAGCILLFKRKEYAKAGFMLLVFLGTPLFYIVDNWVYAGYGRFNLFILPPILLGASTLVEWASERKKGISIGAACLAILVSLMLSPINLDGSKRPYWDNYTFDTAEHYYPYREAISWLKDTYPEEPVLVGGMTYHYYFEFYDYMFNWRPGATFQRADNTIGDPEALSQALVEAQINDYQIVLFQVLDKDIPQLPNPSTFHQEKVFRNSAQVLVVYHMGKP